MDSAKISDTARFGKFFHHMLERGIYLAPSQFEAGFVSAAQLGRRNRQTVRLLVSSLPEGLCEPALPPRDHVG